MIILDTDSDETNLQLAKSESIMLTIMSQYWVNEMSNERRGCVN